MLRSLHSNLELRRQILEHRIRRLKGLRRQEVRDVIKRAMDITGALLLCLLASPLLLVVVAALWREGGPVIYRHRRIGRDGIAFECLKFRTMVPDAERVLKEVLARNPAMQHEWQQDRKLKNDPRITAVGRFLRRTSLDELPQLWNVVRGEMSLVGPRPVVMDELLHRYRFKKRHYMSVTPGITGLWQVMGRNTTTYRRRVALDTYYARHRSLRLDAFILLKTAHVVLAGHGAY